jgi:predicted RNA-binding Zn-ribbon protein involved in translation (DUF1610 family)
VGDVMVEAPCPRCNAVTHFRMGTNRMGDPYRSYRREAAFLCEVCEEEIVVRLSVGRTRGRARLRGLTDNGVPE